jgi:hypothetical protein
MAGTVVSTIDNNKKNYLINGAMDFWQRGSSTSTINNQVLTASSFGGGYHSADRWGTFYNAGPTTRTVFRDSVVPDSSVNYSMRINSDHSGGNGGSGGNIFTWQNVEAEHCADLVGKRVSFSFMVRNETVDEIQVYLQHANSKNNFASTTQIASVVVNDTPSTAWKEIKLENVLIPAGGANGIRVQISFQGQWVSGASLTQIYITKLMLNEGASAAPFRRSGDTLAQEFHNCARYFIKFRPSAARVTLHSITMRSADGNTLYGSLPIPVRMRTNASIIHSGSTSVNLRRLSTGAGVSFTLDISVIQTAVQDPDQHGINLRIDSTNVPLTTGELFSWPIETRPIYLSAEI